MSLGSNQLSESFLHELLGDTQKLALDCEAIIFYDYDFYDFSDVTLHELINALRSQCANTRRTLTQRENEIIEIWETMNPREFLMLEAFLRLLSSPQLDRTPAVLELWLNYELSMSFSEAEFYSFTDKAWAFWESMKQLATDDTFAKALAAYEAERILANDFTEHY